MGNFVDCMKTLGASAEEVIDFDRLDADIKAAQATGQTLDQAQRNAVDMQLTRLQEERQGIINQIPSTKSGGIASGLKATEARAKVSNAQKKASPVQTPKKAETPKKAPSTPASGPTTKESAGTIQAGIDAVGRGGRHAAYSSDPKSVKSVPPGWKTVPAKDGGVYITPPESEQQVKLWDLAGDQHKILGYPNKKPPVGSKTFVVQAKDSKGRVVQDVLTDEAGLEKALSQGKKAAGPGGSVTQIDPVDAQKERAKLHKAEATADGRVKFTTQEALQLKEAIKKALRDGTSVMAIAEKMAKIGAQAGTQTRGVKKIRKRAKKIAIGFGHLNTPFKKRLLEMLGKAQGDGKVKVQQRARKVFRSHLSDVHPDFLAARYRELSIAWDVYFRGYDQYNWSNPNPSELEVADARELMEQVARARKFAGKPTPPDFHNYTQAQWEAWVEENNADYAQYIENIDAGHTATLAIVGELSDMMGVQMPVIGISHADPNTLGAAAVDEQMLMFDIDTLAAIADENATDAVRARALEVVFHEFGHLTQMSVLKAAPIDEQRAVFEAYDKYINESKERPSFMTEIERLPMAMRLAALNKSAADEKLVRPALDAYMLSASEWWANETAKHIGQEVKTGNIHLDSISNKLLKVFKDLYAALKSMFDGGGLPAPAVKAFWDRHVQQVKQYGVKELENDPESRGEIYTMTVYQSKVISEDDAAIVMEQLDAEDANTVEATMQPEVEVTVKHNATARLMNQIFGSTHTTNQDGSRQVTVPEQEPTALSGDPTATHHTVIKAISKVFDTGRTEQRGRIEMYNPFTGKNTRASMPEIIRLGYAINVLNDSATSRRENMLSGLSHMYALGFYPTQVRVQDKSGKWINHKVNDSGELSLPAGMLVDGRENLGTAVTFGELMLSKKRKELTRAERADAMAHLKDLVGTLEKAVKDKASPAFIKQTRQDIADLQKVLRRTKQEALDEYDRKSSILRAMTEGSQADRNKATLKHKEPVSLLREEVKQLKSDLKEYFGVEFKDGQFDNREIIQEQEFAGTRVRDAQADAFIAGRPGLDPNDPNRNPDPTFEDTRGLPTEDDQAAASARDRGPKTGRSAKFPVLRNNKVTQYAEHLHKNIVNMAGDVLKLLNLNTQVIIVDEAGAKHLLDTWVAEHKSLDIKDERRIVLRNKIKRMEKLLTDPPTGRIDYMDNFFEAPLNPNRVIGNAEDRVPVIYIPGGGKTATQMKILTHELGHLVQRTMFDQAPKDVQEAIIKSMGGIKASKADTFEENFANMLWRYLVRLEDKAASESRVIDVRTRPIARVVLHKDAPADVGDAARQKELKQFQIANKWFGRLAAKLLQMWNAVKGSLPIGTDYHQFVQAMTAVGLKQRGFKGPETEFGKKYQKVVEDMTSGPFLPYRTDVGQGSSNYSADDVRALGAKVIRDRRAKAAIAASKGVRDVGRNIVNLAQEKILLSADALLRSIGGDTLDDIANDFHHRPGTRKTKGRTWFEENRYWQGQNQVEIDKILGQLPMKEKKRGYWNRQEIDTESDDYVNLMAMLHGGATIAEFEALGGTVGTVGKQVRQYFDKKLAWLNEQGVSVKQRQNYMPVVADQAEWLQNKGRVMNILRKHGYPEAAAEKIWEAVTKSDGFLGDIYQFDDKLLGPGFGFMRKRKLGPEVIKDLEPFMITDLSNLLSMYSKSATERGVAQRRWGLTAKEKNQLQDEFQSLGIGQHLNSPVAKLHLTLSRALRDGEITADQFRMVKNKVLEAYFGRLGANIDPRWQKFQTAAIIVQNLRLLSMATLTAFVDAGQLAWRTGDGRLAWDGFKTFLDKSSREELYETAHAIGTIQDELTAHVLNDQATTQFMSARAKNMNEKFFRIIGMHQWTNMTRVMGLEMGKRFLLDHAAKAQAGNEKSQKHLEELGVTAEEVQNWAAEGYPVNDLDHDSAHGRVIGALNTFVDEAIVRPDATVRPAWASDRNFQVFFHLKSFLWGYHEVIWRRVAERAKAEPNFQKMLMNGGMSALMLALVTLPFAAAGYEIRRLLSWWGNPPASTTKHGLDYMGELAERAGWLGLMQFVVDAEQAENFGRSSTLSLGGPTVNHIESFLKDDFANFSAKSIPFMAQSGAARQIYRDFIRGD